MRADFYNLGIDKGILNYGLVSLYYNTMGSGDNAKRHECLFWHPQLLKYFDSNVQIDISFGMLNVIEDGKTCLSIPLAELYSGQPSLCRVNDSGFLVKIGYYNSNKMLCYHLNYNEYLKSPIYKELKIASNGGRPSFYDERVFVKVNKEFINSDLILIESADNKSIQVYGLDGTPFVSMTCNWLSRSKWVKR